jgi:arsenate reductase (thioredoxin)
VKDTYNVLFLCTGNSARSIMAEALATQLGRGRLQGFSAGSHPSGTVQPLAAKLAIEAGYPAGKLRSKAWEEYAAPGAPEMDFIITVCDNAAGELCPIWPGHPAAAHWGVADPALTPDDPEAFKAAWLHLRRRIELLLALPLDKLDALATQAALRKIATDT